MFDLNSILFLAVIYIAALGLGSLISKFWFWFRILVLCILVKGYFNRFDFQEINLSVCLSDCDCTSLHFNLPIFGQDVRPGYKPAESLPLDIRQKKRQTVSARSKPGGPNGPKRV